MKHRVQNKETEYRIQNKTQLFSHWGRDGDPLDREITSQTKNSSNKKILHKNSDDGKVWLYNKRKNTNKFVI
jgi:hypothetical protein